MTKGFNLFRINCWLEDLTDNSYEKAIGIAVYEYLLSRDNKEVARNDIYGFIKNDMGIKVNYEAFKNFIDGDQSLSKEALDTDVLVRLTDEALDNFRQRENKYSINLQIKKYVTEFDLSESVVDEIESILTKSLFVNINSFIVNDLKTLISEDIKNDFTADAIEHFNNFLEWDDEQKNKAIFSLFEKAIEFAILTSGRGVKSITKDIFKDKTYYLDANVIIRALGIDGTERQESVISILHSCKHDGIDFKISKTTYDEIKSSLNNRTKEIKAKANSDLENILKDVIDDLPLNNSFETHYVRKRKDDTVKSPSNYRLFLEKELQLFLDTFDIKVERIKGISSSEIDKLADKLKSSKHEDYGILGYSKGSAIVDAKNILHVRKVRDRNDHNYRDIKSFYLTTDVTLNEIISSSYPDIVPETILPSQVFIIHNSFQNIADKDDYKDFVNFIKIRRTEFKLSGREVFDYIDQVRSVTSNAEDIVSTINAYANYRLTEKNKGPTNNHKIIPLKEFTELRLEKELLSSRKVVDKVGHERNKAKSRITTKFKYSTWASYLIEILILSIFAILLHLVIKNGGATLLIVGLLIAFRIILFISKDKFKVSTKVRNFIFDQLLKSEPYLKIHSDDSECLQFISNLKGDTRSTT